MKFFSLLNVRIVEKAHGHKLKPKSYRLVFFQLNN